MKSEIRQIHLCDTFDPQHRYELSAKEKAEILESHMFIKLKRYGKIKIWEFNGGKNKETSLARRK